MLLIAFSYLFTLTIAVACVALPWLAVQHGLSVANSLILLVMGIVIAVTIIISLVPRREKFETPGVQINIAKQHRLEALIQEITAVLNEEMPDAVYVNLEANAWVTERGGWLGFGSKRVMVLGWPLLALLTVGQLRAVIAHECAHFYAGDTWLAPRIYTMQSAMVRVLTNLSADSTILNALNRIGFARLFHALITAGLGFYWKLLLRGTQLISRQQEYRSDELAGYIAGSEALMEGLKKLQLAEIVSSVFWTEVVNPLLSAGCIAPIADSFCRFTSSTNIKQVTDEALPKILMDSNSSPYDSHPPLKLRFERLEKQSSYTQANGGEPAIALFDDLEAVERQLLDFASPKLKDRQLKPFSWESEGPLVYFSHWHKFLKDYETFTDFTVGDIPQLLKKIKEVAVQIRDPQGVLLTREQRESRIVELVSIALALQLFRHGWKLYMQPGMFYMFRESEKIIPREVINDLLAGKITSEGWSAQCEAYGLPLTVGLTEAVDTVS